VCISVKNHFVVNTVLTSIWWLYVIQLGAKLHKIVIENKKLCKNCQINFNLKLWVTFSISYCTNFIVYRSINIVYDSMCVLRNRKMWIYDMFFNNFYSNYYFIFICILNRAFFLLIFLLVLQWCVFLNFWISSVKFLSCKRRNYRKILTCDMFR